MQQVGEKLHEPAVAGGSAVYPKLLERAADVGLHGVENVANLVADGFQSRTHDVCARTAFRKAADQPSGVGLPMWRAQTGQRRHKVDAAIVGQLRGLFAQGIYGFAGHQPRSPLHRCAGVHNVAFHCIS
ncbi:hypothetical protein ALO94_200937 [Pseudomonas syringae pv. spinaceae]|uniref:Ribonuclease D n=1 Tax=Pseudomonas syringae pv. spinaceae TaxID=264459 RepID=A0A0N8T4Z7_PSESX|nr:hypothetical protein ALO94_200937 [Pseudomonas syringae pv. spinaceae]